MRFLYQHLYVKIIDHLYQDSSVNLRLIKKVLSYPVTDGDGSHSVGSISADCIIPITVFSIIWLRVFFILIWYTIHAFSCYKSTFVRDLYFCHRCGKRQKTPYQFDCHSYFTQYKISDFCHLKNVAVIFVYQYDHISTCYLSVFTFSFCILIVEITAANVVCGYNKGDYKTSVATKNWFYSHLLK